MIESDFKFYNVDKITIHAARYVDKNIIASEMASKSEIQFFYAIEIVHAVYVMIDIFETSKYTNEELTIFINKIIDLLPVAIIKYFDQQKTIYKRFTVYWPIGGEDYLHVKWDKIDKIEGLRQYFSKK